MSNIKVLKNFKCNGVKKKIGQFLSKEELKLMGEKLGEELFQRCFLQAESDAPVGMILDELSKPGLWKYAKDLGLNPHHNTGENKLKEMIKKKMEA